MGATIKIDIFTFFFIFFIFSRVKPCKLHVTRVQKFPWEKERGLHVLNFSLRNFHVNYMQIFGRNFT